MISTFVRSLESSGTYKGKPASKYFDDLYQDDSKNISRVMYCRTIPVESGTVLTAFGSDDDTTETGGKTTIKKGKLYYSALKFDKDGKIVYDGEWRDITEPWVIGVTENGSSYGETAEYNTDYPRYAENETYESAKERRKTVKYVIIVFRVANGNLGLGSGMGWLYYVLCC